MKQIFSNATILRGEEFEIVEGYIVVEDGIIKELESGRCPYKDAIDIKKGIIFPAFTNAHVHLGDSLAKDIGAYEHIEKRVGKNSIKTKILEGKNAALCAGIRYSLKEMLKSGTTAFCDFREGGIKGINQLKSSLIGSQKTVILGRPDGEEINQVLKECHGIGISSVKDYTEEELEEIASAAKNQKKMLAMHVAETEDDVEESLKYKPNFIVHATNASEESLEKIFSSRTPIVLCPRANAMLGVGIPRLKEIFENSLAALGTDNVMVNSLSMFREMEFTFKMLRGQSKDYKFDGREILRAATINGRKILKLESNAIKEEAKANFIILKRRKYLYDPVLAIIHRCETGDIIGMVNV